MMNPLACATKSITVDDVEINITRYNASQYFKHAFVLTKIDDNPIPLQFYTDFLDNKLYDETSSRIILKKVSLNILKHNNHSENMIIMSDVFINSFNKLKYKLDKSNLIIIILNSSFIKLESYLMQFSNITTLESIYNIIIYNKYFNNISNLTFVIESMKKDCFWTNLNVLLQISNRSFTNRRFNFDTMTIKDDDAKNALKTMGDYMNSKDGYSYTNITKYIKKKTKYMINHSEIFTREDILHIFMNLKTDKEKYLLLCYMLLSKNGYLVLNNNMLLLLLKPIISKYIIVIRYLIGYTWSLFYLNESIKNTFTKTDDPYIFDIETASNLPVFPFHHNSPKYNPYSTLFIDTNYLRNNICGIEQKELQLHRIATLDEFTRAFNLFSTGDEKQNLFENVDFSNNIAISGSSITACSQKSHRLLDIFTGESHSEKLMKFFNEYYSDSDIDVMIKTSDLSEYFKIVNNLYNTIVTNILRMNPSNTKREHVKLILNKKCNFFVPKSFFDIFVVLGDPDINYIKENINKDPLLKKIINDIYIQKIVTPLLETDNVQYKELFDDNIEFSINVNDNPNNSDTKIIMNYKYTIKSPHLLHNIEIFQVRYDDFFATVSRFHLPCVRAYYNGSNVYMTPSFITSQMTFMNIDYKYFAGTKDPIEIINKYRMRGYGTWLSPAEIRQYNTYSKTVPFWSNILYSGDENRVITGPISVTSNFFRPRYYNQEFYLNTDHVDLENRYNPIGSQVWTKYNNNTGNSALNDELQKIYNFTPCILDSSYMYKIDTFNLNSDLNTVKSWLIPAYYDIYNA